MNRLSELFTSNETKKILQSSAREDIKMYQEKISQITDKELIGQIEMAITYIKYKFEV